MFLIRIKTRYKTPQHTIKYVQDTNQKFSAHEKPKNLNYQLPIEEAINGHQMLRCMTQMFELSKK